MPIPVSADGAEAPVPDVETLREEVGAAAGSDDAALERCIAEAVALVSRHVQIHAVEGLYIPAEIATAAYLKLATELYYRRNARFGIVNEQYQTDVGDVTGPIRVSRDVLAGVKPMLQPWLMPIGFA